MMNVVSLLSGVLFAVGLGLSGMTQPHVVRGFLDVFGDWDWRLMGVMIGAISVHAVAYRFIQKRSSPVLAPVFYLPTRKDIDSRLILGSIIFGLGWGWAGICPGPGLVSLVSGKAEFFYFIGSMLFGMIFFQLINNRFNKK